MKNNNEKSFIASYRVVRHKLGVKAADVLAVLIYKYEYWKSTGDLISRGGEKYFFITLSDLKAETCFSEKVIAKNIKILVKAGLVLSIRQGLSRPNLYSVDQEVVDRYISEHSVDLEKWQTKIREKTEGARVKVINHKSTSGITEKGVQEVSKESATKNKNTKNRNTENTFTNRASSACEIHSESLQENEIELEKEISDLRSADDSDINERVTSLFKFLCSLVPSFKGFSMSSDDRELLLTILQSEIQDYKIASKIISNTSDIINGKKDSRFGSLFVGVVEMIANFENLCV